jgi:hypothetical protein
MGQTPGVLPQITLGWHTLPPPEAGKSTPKGKIEMSDAENMGEQLMRLDAPVRRTDGQVLDGKSWTTFDLAESKGPVKVSVRL